MSSQISDCQTPDQVKRWLVEYLNSYSSKVEVGIEMASKRLGELAALPPSAAEVK